ncbi:MAG: iron donor protein CyaY [Myxococcales bacterium]|nr:iron donor protein CyaY [Myxococcales bacterium]
MNDTRLSETEFEPLAEAELGRLLEALIVATDAIDADLQSGVLSIQFADESKYVVNSHRAARQIWLAAARSAWHFDWDRGSERWLTSEGAELWATVGDVLERKLSVKLELTAS